MHASKLTPGQYTACTELEVCKVWFFPLLLCSCVAKINSCSWYDSWSHRNYQLLLLF